MSAVSTYTDWREARRFRAWELFQQGWKPIRIAEALGVTPGAVSRWFAKAEAVGPIALAAKKAAGASPRLTAEQLARLPALLRQGAVAHGFTGNVWTSERVAVLIERTFDVRYAASHVRRLLRKLGWSRQKPIRRATQRDEEAIATWAEERYPELKKMPKRGQDPAVYR
jgi:transposase